MGRSAAVGATAVEGAEREHLIDLGVLGQIERVRKLAKMAWSVPLEEQEQMARNFQQVGMAIYLKKPKQEHPSKPKEDSSDFKESCKDTTAVKEAAGRHLQKNSHGRVVVPATRRRP